MTTPSTFQKLPLAKHRYGREEMLLFYSETLPYPSAMANIPTLILQQPVSPIAMTPITPDEQVGVVTLYPKHYLSLYLGRP